MAANNDDSLSTVISVAMSFLRLNEGYLQKRYGITHRPTDLTYDIDLDIPAFWGPLSGTSCGAGIVGRCSISIYDVVLTEELP